MDATKVINTPNPNYKRKLGLKSSQTRTAFSSENMLLAEAHCHTSRDDPKPNDWQSTITLRRVALPQQGYKTMVLSEPGKPLEFNVVMNDLALSTDGKRLALLDGNCEIRVWDVATNREVSKFRLPREAIKIALSPDYRTLAAGHTDGTVSFWLADSGWKLNRSLFTIRNHVGQINALAFSKDGKLLASGAEDTIVKIGLINVDSRQNVTYLQEGADFVQEVLAKTQPIVGDSKIITKTTPRNLTFSPNGSLLASIVTYSFDGPQSIRGRVWELSSRKEISSFPANFDDVELGFSRDANRIIKISNYGRVEPWRARIDVSTIQQEFHQLASAVISARIFYESAIKANELACQEQQAQLTAVSEDQVVSIKDSYESVISRIVEEEHSIVYTAGLAAIRFDQPQWQSWIGNVDQVLPRYVRIGRFVEKGKWHDLRVTALLPFIDKNGVLFTFRASRQNEIVFAAQCMLLRLLGTVPPAKLYFTFLDPVGLGQNVAPFMHLADYDEQLVTGKAWTEPNHIEQRLADLTEHMENVIQKYLRNQFATIEDYNKEAGEVAEPYRVLVVMDFPANFSETAARRLVSIAQNGPRCGVYAIVLADTSKPMPHGFNLADLERASTVIAWDASQNRFVWQDEDFKDCLLELDTPPDKELFDRIIQTVGKATKAAAKVEVPFERMFELFAPQLELHREDYPGLGDALNPMQSATWWRGETDTRLFALLGRSGAKRIQCLDLGKSTAQHALVAGKTGSGKSTLLHTLITSAALTYSPDELELYLIDFKKGVEFKTYAVNQLPHARVIAIESEREFGLSVLQGLDAELKRRGDLFRKMQVDELADYRNKRGESLPRVLLLVDEFQEFFTEDDSITSQAAQILDRLVRQGRAFGMHVLLGSQTLAGAYSLARSTIDQMAVRIALQCSEADSRLILADDNPAARLLSRPGEAIYNSSNGTVEGNNRFQVAWLTDEQHEKYLAQIREFAKQSEHFPPQSQIIFEGNAPAEIEKNRPLHDALTATPSAITFPISAWLGDPIAIRLPIAATFRRQSGSNLLLVGQSDEAALGMFTSALISLVAQYPVSNPESPISNLNLLDFGAVDGPFSNFFARLNEQMGNVLKIGRRRELPALIDQLAQETTRRMDGETGGAPIYLFIYGLQRARDLRQEDTMNFSLDADSSSTSNPAQQFNTILREGPDVGIFTIVWCDTLTNLNRALDRRALREFAMRVVMQMSVEDSANLIDTPAASKLGPYRALFYSEEEGRLEKFRPYALPSEMWLERAAEQLKQRRTATA